MASSTRRAVLTGLGVITPIGLGKAAFWDSLRNQRGGIGPITAFDASALPIRIAGQVQGFDAKNYIDKKERKSLKVMSRSIQLAVAAAQMALEDSGIDKNRLDPTRFGVEFGAGLIASELEELGVASQRSVLPVEAPSVGARSPDQALVDLEKWGSQGLPCMPPLWMLKYLPNMLACHVSILHNAQGPNNTITENDVASLLALGEAYRILVRDQADFFLVGGADSKINPLSLVRQSLFLAMSKRNDEPDKACRPFDRQRDGIVPGEGAGVLGLEELEHARKRGARIYAELVGFGAAFDRGCTGNGLARAMRAALADASVGPEEIDHVNAQGFSSQASDAWEARNIQEVFADTNRQVPIFALKSYVGSLGAGSGTAELVGSVLALEHAMLPPTLNYHEPDPACPAMVCAGKPQPVTRVHVLKVGFTEMGQCAAVVLRKW
jgi:3-oxoacyl-[acyl-carrier-protein] synthase II